MKYDIELDIATADSSRAVKWRNTRTTWGALVETLRETERTRETIKQYFSYTKDRQGQIKDVGGFVGGYLREGRRLKGNVEYRQVITLDVDYGGLDAWETFALLEYAGVMYTTHKHTPEKPRYRIVAPLARRVSPDEYEAIARTVAALCGIDHFDDTTYQPSRLMYYPSTARDGEYLFDMVDAPIIDPDAVLAELPNWKDPTTWPVSSRVREVVRHKGTNKAEDPTEKVGIVGAFCRAFTMEEVLAEFLSEVYAPCEELGANRYTLIGGSTSGGLVVYDNRFAYSHHSTDPAGEKLCNAFDLVRLHRFGELDEKAKPDTEVVKLPSYKAMAALAAEQTRVKKELLRETVADYEGEEPGEIGDWVAALDTEDNGAIRNTIDNVVTILSNDPNLKGCFGFNEFEQRETAVRALPWDRNVPRYPRPLCDRDDAELRLYLEKCYNLTKKDRITDGLTIVVHANSYHPVRDYLDALEWDGTPRLDTLFIDLFGADDTPYTRAVTRKAFTAAVARIYTPGIKYDYVVTIIGDQGQGKSTTLKRMGREWFNESLEGLTGKEAMEQIQGSWIFELAELDALKRADISAVKHFISKTEDRYRVAYGKRVEHFPRRCVFFGTTNEEDFLRDVTGNRRFWVINCKGRTGRVRFNDYLTEETVAQLWAEAKERRAQGESLYLAEEGLEEQARAIQDAHLEKDERGGLVREYLERLLPEDWEALDPYQRRTWLADSDNRGKVKRRQVCVLEIWTECLGKDPNSITRRDSFEISRVMKSFREWQPGAKVARFRYYGIQKNYTRQV